MLVYRPFSFHVSANCIFKCAFNVWRLCFSKIIILDAFSMQVTRDGRREMVILKCNIVHARQRGSLAYREGRPHHKSRPVRALGKYNIQI